MPPTAARWAVSASRFEEADQGVCIADCSPVRRIARASRGEVIGTQMLRSGTSVGAHYREATRARSTAEFVSKLEGGLMELEETAYWMELLQDGEFVAASRLQLLFQEIDELTAIFVTSTKSAKRTLEDEKKRKRKRQKDQEGPTNGEDVA